MRTKWNLCLMAMLAGCLSLPVNANVSQPPAPPAPPAGYCSTIYNELQGYLDTFNQTLGNPAPYPTLQIAQLQIADSNAGPGISNPDFLSSTMVQVQALKALGFQGVKVEVAFPVLYEPFFGSTAAMQPYLDYYTQLAQNLKDIGMKLVIENNVTLSTGTEVGWGNVADYYRTLSWNQFVAGRAAMAATIAQHMQPDFLMLSQEPDNEAANAFQPNLNNPIFAAQMIAAEIASARAVSMNIKLGAGFGTWMGPYSPSGLQDYLNAYLALPLDYIDMHIYAINTEYHGLSNLLNNALIIADQAAAASKPVAISESWPWKMEDGEFNVLAPDTFRARSTFSFWAPIDTYFMKTMAKLANYTQMLYLTTQGNDYLLAYQTYGGTAENGGAANCTCTTESCSDGEITATENSMAFDAAQAASFTNTGLAYYNYLVDPPDSLAPTGPTQLSGTAGYTSATITWTGSTDNIGVAGYNIYRCTAAPPAPCQLRWIANSAATTFFDTELDDNTSYQYEVQAFDVANHTSLKSNLIEVHTWRNSPPDPPSPVILTPVSPKEIDLSWQPPLNTSDLSKYLIYRGTTPSNLVQVANMPGTSTTYRDVNLTASTRYCYGVVSVAQGLNSDMSVTPCAYTLPLPNAPVLLVATPVSPTKITLTWTEIPVEGGLQIANYQVWRAAVPGAFSKVGTASSTTYNSTGLTANTTYAFYVVAVDKSFDYSIPSPQVSATTLPLPPAPTNLQATPSSATVIKLTWEWAPLPRGLQIAHYNVYCGTTPTGPTKPMTKTSYTFSGATPATLYYCNVSATDSGNNLSPVSSTVHLVTPPLPNAPTNVQATTIKSTMVTLTWLETVPPNGLPIGSYKIYRSTTLPVTLSNYVATRTAATYTDTTVTASKTYYYAIAAIDSGAAASTLSDSLKVDTPIK